MLTAYDETKTTQLAAYFPQKSEGEMFLLKLLKLLYITDSIENIREQQASADFFEAA